MPKLRVITRTPPEPQGDPEQQVAQLRDYLLQLCEELAYLLTHLEADNINDSTFERIQGMIPKAYTGLPPMDGEANGGSANAWARGDHRHPNDDSKADAADLTAHIEDTANPHSVTKAQVGLGNVANERQYSVQNPPPTPTPAQVGAIPATEKGSAGGVAELDANGMVPSAQLPSYVDDVLEYASQSAFPATGEAGKIYVALDTNKTYRWSGSAYVEISESLALGETSSTAYRGDRGKTAYDHSQVTSGNPHNVTAAEVGARPDTWTPSASDVGAQPAITASGILKGDGLGGVSAATAGTDYQAPLTAGTDYQTPLVADVDYQTPLVADVDYQTPLVAGTDYQTPLAAGTDYQTPLVAGTDYQTPLVAGTDYQTPLTAGTDYATPAMIPTVPDPSDATPQDLGTADAGVSDDYSRADHVHEKPTYTASDVGLGNVDNVQQYSVNNPPPVPDAEDIPYDNTTSGLTATDLQAAVDELAQGGSAAASAVSYDNTGSGLLATDVQDAIDELANGGGGSTPSASVIPYSNTGSGLTANNVQDAIDEVLGDIPVAPSDIGAQDSITANGLLKGDGLGGVSAAVSGTDYQAPLTAGTDYQTPLVAGTDYQTPLVAGTDYQTPLVADVDYQTPLAAGTDYQTPLVAGTDYATPAMIPSVPSISTSTPNMDGTGAAGSTGEVSDAGHTHPSDTTKANQAQLAYVETGSTASRAYAIGEYFCLGGQLCRAKTAISQGDTFTLNTNYEVPSGGGFNGILAKPYSPTLNASYVDTENSTLKFYSFGGIAYIFGTLKITSNIPYNGQIGSYFPLPSLNNVWIYLIGGTTKNVYLTRILGGNNANPRQWIATTAMTKATDEYYYISGSYPTI